MRIVRPSVQMWNNINNESHILRCAQVCYASEKNITDVNSWLESKWKNGHKSIFRHGTYYFAIPVVVCTEYMRSFFKNSPYVGYYENKEWVFISINGQTYREITWFHHLFKYSTSEIGLQGFIEDDADRQGITNIIRKTLFIQTQISTSRELNRTSPNNICEQSTRYCNFTLNKFEGEVSICEPWWLSLVYDYKKDKDIEFIDIYEENNNLFIKYNNKIYKLDNIQWPIVAKDPKYNDILEDYLKSAIASTNSYNNLVKAGAKPQDARGLLPLDTLTKLVYTYRIEEWKHILDLRYYGTTGKPHPNAEISANQIREVLNTVLPKDEDDMFCFPYFPEKIAPF